MSIKLNHPIYSSIEDLEKEIDKLYAGKSPRILIQSLIDKIKEQDADLTRLREVGSHTNDLINQMQEGQKIHLTRIAELETELRKQNPNADGRIPSWF